MNDNEVRNQLSLYLGLDDETINQSILPYLKSMKSRAELQDYLTGLLGNDSAQSHFIAGYANSRFPPAVAKTAKQPQAPPATKATSTSSHQQASTSQNRAQPRAPPASAAAPAPGAATNAFPSSSSNAKLQLVQAPAVNISLPATSQASTSARTLEHVSSEAAAEIAQRKLRQLEQRLRAAKGQSKEKACFCQAQEHPLSTVIPICSKCLLVLCDVNVPYNRACPSCGFRPLVSDAVLAEKIAQLEAERDAITSREKERLRLESEEEERARRAIQFPGLHEGRTPSPSGVPGGGIDYARKAGAGSSHNQQVQQAYRTAQAREEAIAASGERRVLSLNSKTKKVQYQTVRPKKINVSAAEALNKQKKGAKPDDFEDDRKPYIDENDDGILGSKQAELARSALDYSWPPKQSGRLTYVARRAAGQDNGPTSEESDMSEDDDETDDIGDMPGDSTAT